ncbi:MAG: hypothetical protein OEW11_04020 [Nitrospirota bacterium]|nr:hypothetical protein [Nitrospirota bacterium]
MHGTPPLVPTATIRIRPIVTRSAAALAVAALLSGGCAGHGVKAEAPRFSVSGPVHVQVMDLPDPQLSLPATGAGEGAARGAMSGGSMMLDGASNSSAGAGALLAIGLAPVAMVVSGVVGAVAAEDDDNVNSARTVILGTVGDPSLRLFMAMATADAVQRNGQVTLDAASESTASPSLRMEVTQITLVATKKGINPRLWLTMTGTATLLDAAGAPLGSRPFSYTGKNRHKFIQWAEDNGTPLRQELETAFQQAARQAADMLQPG